jgi:hypothetical protein
VNQRDHRPNPDIPAHGGHAPDQLPGLDGDASPGDDACAANVLAHGIFLGA